MMVVWTLATLSGVLLWIAPDGPRSGYRVLLFSLSKREWGELHAWFSFIAIAITIAHLVVDWRALCGCVKYLASVHRPRSPANAMTSRPVRAQGIR
jgi:hypothetical protein